MAIHLNEPCSNDWEKEKFLIEPYIYITKENGKQIRTKLVNAFNHWIKVPKNICHVVGEIMEMLHNSSLIIDDIEDGSVLRRGVPVAHNIYGVASAINCANYVYFIALHKIITELPSTKASEATKIYTKHLIDLHRGQGMEIYWRDNQKCPTEQEYLTMVQLKTGALFCLGVKLLQLFSDEKTDFTNLISLLGSTYQVRDDYLNLKSASYAENKSFAEDLTEGKFSFPITHAINSNPDDHAILNIVRQRTTNLELKKFAIRLIEDHGSFNYTLSVLDKFDKEARKEIEALGGNDFLTKFLDSLRIETCLSS